jgi:hypothetical protein
MSAVVLHSITRVVPAHAGRVVVTGSHGGIFAAAVALRYGVDAVLFNDASGGKDGAGVAGIEWLDRYGVAAAAVAHLSAPIGDGEATLRTGVLVVVNEAAHARGCRAGQTAADAAAVLGETAGLQPRVAPEGIDVTEARHAVRPGVVALDSVSLVTPGDRHEIVVTGSHGALLGGDPASAVKFDVRAAVYNDAGRGPDGRGTTRLPVLAARGIPAVTVSAESARIGDGRSTYADGIVTVANEPARAAGVRPDMSVADFVDRIERLRGKP